MIVLVVNCGSSSVKLQLIQTDAERQRLDQDLRLARCHAERVGGDTHITCEAAGHAPVVWDSPSADHGTALATLLDWLVTAGVEGIRSLADIHAVGHRVVHGGERFTSSVRIEAEVLEAIEACADLAPLHNPANLAGIRATRDLLGPQVPQVAVFDTAFHSNMPERARVYGIPYELSRRHRIQRYGFHGTSHRYVTSRYAAWCRIPRQDVHAISLHLGNGCSACAVRAGASVDTSMGFTPLEGLLMGTRAGDLDASLLHFLSDKEGMSLQELDFMLNERSGLLGLSGTTGDMRDLLAAAARQDPRASLAIDVFCYRVRKYIGAYYAALEGASVVLFTGGIGENSPEIRQRIATGLECIGLRLDSKQNDACVGGVQGAISSPDASLAAWVIPTDEERMIAHDVYASVGGAS